MYTTKKLFLAAVALVAISLPTLARGQAKVPESIANAQKEAEIQIATLPAEDQEMVKGLKFTRVELAPMDSRHFVFIKGNIRITNSGPKNVISGKLKAEALMLCRNKDKQWVVIRAVSGLDVASKGTKVIDFDFKETNDQFLKSCGDKNTLVYDSYTVIRYSGITIAELHAKPTSSDPKEWWKDDKLVYKK